MLLWVMFGCLTAVTLAAVLRPLYGSPGAAAEQAPSNQPHAAPAPAELAVYTDQLDQLKHQLAQGQLDAGEYEQLRVEVARRILRADVQPTGSTVTKRENLAWSGMTMVLVPLSCLALYALLGSPNIPGRPYAANAGSLINASAAELIAKVEARLAAHPDDVRGWDAIAPIYFKLERFADAADAYQRAMRLTGETTPRLAGFAEATVLANDGIVTELARIAYQKLALMDASRFEPRFWLALAKEQDGKRDEAAADYRAILAEAPVDAPWREMVEQRLATVSQSSSRPRGPSSADVAAAAALPEADRAAMIDGMVAALAARLHVNGKDLAGWQKLIGAYSTQRKIDQARQALADARRALAGDAPSLSALDGQEKKLGLQQ